MNQTPLPGEAASQPASESAVAGKRGMEPGVWCTVRAAAGSGKTRLLVRRLLRICLECNDPTRFLAVTFTNKAAAEMKERLLAASREFLTPKGTSLAVDLTMQPGSPKVAGFYWTLLDSFSRVRVSTIHAFCNEIVARFAWECRLAPQLTVLDSVSHERLRQVCNSQFLTRPDWEDPATLLGAAFAKLKAAGLKGSAIVRMLPVLESSVNLWRSWLLESEPEPYDLDMDPLLWPAEHRDDAGPLDGASPAEEPLLPMDAPEWARFAEFLEGKASGRGSLKDALAAKLRMALGSSDGQALLSLLPELEGLAEKSNTKWRATVAASTELADVRRLWIPTLQRQGAQAAAAWVTVALEYLRELQGLKRRLGAIDFSDMEWIASSLLTRDAVPGLTQYVLFSLSQRLLHLAVDEFQDTADLQWRMLHHLADLVSGQETGEAGSAFCVGDVKQSIYRFRNAEPELMEVARTELARLARLAGRPYADLKLDVSYRSTPAVLELTAALFAPQRGTGLQLPAGESAHVAGHRSGEAAWGKVVVEPYFEGADEESEEVAADGEKPAESEKAKAAETEKAAGSVQAEMAEAGVTLEASGQEAGAMTPLERRAQLETTRTRGGPELCARWCADLVQRLVREEEPVFDSSEKAWRPARYRDMLVLLETRTHAESFESAFRRAGIPFVAAGRGAMAARTEFQDLMSVVQWVLRPMNDLAFTSMLRSPLFRIPEADLLALRRRPGAMQGERRKPGRSVAPDLFQTNWRNSGRLPSLWQVLQTRADDDELPISLVDAFPQLRELERCWSYSPVELFVKLEREFGLLGRYGGVFNPGVEANFRLFWTKAVELESAGVGSLARFAEEMTLLASGEEFSDAPLPATDDAGMVRFLTVHGAKGLEAPIVILPDTWRKSLSGKLSEVVTVRDPETRRWKGVLPDMGSLYPVARTMENWPSGLAPDPYRQAQEVANQRAKDERACLDYVAVTRARDHLYIGGFVSGSASRAPEATPEQPSTLHVEAWEAAEWLRAQQTVGGAPGGLRSERIPTNNNADPKYRDRLVIESGQRPLHLMRPVAVPITPLPVRAPLGAGASVLFEEEVASRGGHELTQQALLPEQESAWAGVGQLEAVERAMNRGTALHAVMEAAALTEGRLDREWALALVQTHCPDLSEAHSVVQEAMDLLADPALAPYLTGPGLSEQPLVSRQSAKGVRFGIPDRVAIFPDRVAILDFKTQAHPERVDAVLKAKYAAQLRTYADLIRQLMPLPGMSGGADTPVEAWLLWTRTRQLERAG